MDRRTLISAAALTPVAIAAPAVAQTMFCAPVDQVDLYLQYEREFNSGMHSDDGYAEQCDRLYHWEPSNYRQFTKKFLAIMDDAKTNGMPADYIMFILEADAKRIAA